MAFYLEKDYFEDVELFNLVQQVMSGDLTLHWYDAKTERVVNDEEANRLLTRQYRKGFEVPAKV